MDNTETVAMTEIEERLANDVDGSFHSELVQKLEDYRMQLKRSMDAGLSVDDFSVAQKVMDAIDAALSVLQALKNN